MNKIRLHIDGYEIEAAEGQNLLEAADAAGIYIPHLCYHPDLTPQGGCKLCTVEIEGIPECVQSCETLVKEGMVVNTKSPKVKQLRNIALELMLASHPKDCTSCDKYLNCELQALMQYMGVAHSRMFEIEKQNTRVLPSDKLIKREMYRCIQCGRCVRACKELRGIGVLAYNKRDGEGYIGTLEDRPLAETDCRFCGACVEVCPTGAIQDVRDVFSKDSPKNLAYIPCKDRCPAHTDIPTYIRLAGEGRYSEAVSVLRERLTFPHALGYVCTHVCESGCKRAHVDEAVSIREMKRFAIENDPEATWKSKIQKSAKTGKRVAVIGGGPAGMTAAYYLAKKGVTVTVYERQPSAGGMLTYGIPKYRLPQSIVDSEIEMLKEMGIELRINSPVQSIDALKQEHYDGILVAVGANRGKRPPQYRGQWKNAMDAVDFCRMANEGTLPELGSTVTVYGGGNVGFDCARTAKKMGVSEVRIICLESREAMLADAEEITCGIREGITLLNRTSIEELIESEGSIAAMKLVDVKHFHFGKNGLELEVEESSVRTLEAGFVVFATGQTADLDNQFGLELLENNLVKTNESLETSTAGIFATGDAVYGTKSVIEAIASGRRAAENMNRYLGGDGNLGEILYDRKPLNPCIGIIEDFGALERSPHIIQHCAAEHEGKRCLQCDLRLDIQKVRYWVDAHYKTVKGVTQ